MRTDGRIMWNTALTPEVAEAVDKAASAYGSRADFLKAMAWEKGGLLRDHHTYPLQPIGSSDIASLTLRFADGVYEVSFGEDGSYTAYIADAFCMIPKHYRLVCEGTWWLRVYDDDGLAYRCEGALIRVYRAGSTGCIIQVLEGD